MISSAIWNKYARVNFSKTNKSAQACRASTLCGLWKIYRCLFIPNCMRKIMWLPIIKIHKKHNYNKNFDSVRVFSSFNGLAETDYHLYQIQTFSRPMFPNNHSAKNLEMCKDWFYMVTSRLKITQFTIISKTKCYEGSAFTRRLLQEVYCCFGNQERTLWAARDKTLAELFNDCSSLSVPKTSSQLNSWRKFWDLQPENEQGAICFLSTLPSLGEWTHSCCDVGNCQY